MLSDVRVMVALLRTVLVPVFLLLTMFQWLSFPGQFRAIAGDSPSWPWRWPLTVLAGLTMLCAQVAVASLWRSLGIVRDHGILSPSLDRWLGAMGLSLLCTAAVAGCTWLALVVHADDPGGPIMFLMLVMLNVVVALLVGVVRSALRAARSPLA